MIRLSGLTFSHRPGAARLFEGLDFTFGEGERAGLVGANGSGKTTLFHLIMGLLRPQAGEIEVFGRKVASEADFRLVREQLGLLFQDPDDQLFCPTVAEDVAFGPLNLGLSHAEAHAIVHETLERLGLNGFEDRVTFALSGGEKKLASLATVLAMRPRVLLLDEPTAGLDEATTERIVRLLQAPGLSYIIISHDRDFLARTTGTTYRLREGRISKD
jgi:cobalt/nickel transport system ATP-binding protein